MTLRPRSLERTTPPTKEEQEKFGFCDIATAIVSTMGATQIDPNPSKKASNVTHRKIATMLKVVVAKTNEKLKNEIHEEL